MAAAVPDEVPVGDTSVVCFKYTLDGTLCEVLCLSVLALALELRTCEHPDRSRRGRLAIVAGHQAGLRRAGSGCSFYCICV
jgi:hypothetical protein